jgi:hypothetical protein
LYALAVEERLDLDQYFRDQRFAYKKPSRRTPEERCGDNFYERLPSGSWKQHWNFFHATQQNFIQDTRRPIAFVGRRFWYFGENHIDVPQFGLKVGGRGTRVSHDPGAPEKFIGWLEHNYPIGRHGLPLHYARAGA